MTILNIQAVGCQTFSWQQAVLSGLPSLLGYARLFRKSAIILHMITDMNKQNTHPQTYNDIDWNVLWQNARKRKSWNSKQSDDWDKKAPSFAKRNRNSPYISLFLSHLVLDDSLSVLDVGCGPGTLAIPLAAKVRRVTCIDYSKVMLELVEQRAEEEGLTNIQTDHCAWEDDWKANNIDVHDFTISSRSIGVQDLAGALKKLNNFTRKRVFVTDRISPTPFDPEAFAAIGRPFDAGPDYIYTVNCLYSLGIHPSVTILELDSNFSFATIEEAVESYSWMFKDLSTAETKKLTEYVQSRVVSSDDSGLTVHRMNPPRWALISWQPSEKL